MTVIFFSLKYTNLEVRPDGHDNASWPSGHTEQAFAAASFLQKEYGYRSILYSIGGYTVATGVGVMRILNNKHYLPDVLIGAAAGILSTNLVYLTHQNRWGKNKTKKNKNQALLLPTYGRGAGALLLLKVLLSSPFLYAQKPVKADTIKSGKGNKDQQLKQIKENKIDLHSDSTGGNEPKKSILIDTTVQNKYGDLLNDDAEYNKKYPIWIPAVEALGANALTWSVDRYILNADYARIGLQHGNII